MFHTNKILYLLAIVAAYFAISASGEPVVSWLRGTSIESTLIQLGWTNTILFNLSIGYLVSLFFWLIVVDFPERNRRTVLRNSLDKTYKYFKNDIVQILLWASNASCTTDKVEQLASDHIAFKEFFNADSKLMWYAALNGIQGSAERLRELYFAMESLSLEVTYVLKILPIQDESAHRFLKLLNENIRRLKYYDDGEYDSVNQLGNFLWVILARWNTIDGQMQDDPLQTVINRL